MTIFDLWYTGNVLSDFSCLNPLTIHINEDPINGHQLFLWKNRYIQDGGQDGDHNTSNTFPPLNADYLLCCSFVGVCVSSWPEMFRERRLIHSGHRKNSLQPQIAKI